MSSHAPGTPTRTYPPARGGCMLYGTCLVDTFVPEAGMDAITLLEREGIRVIFPDNQTCCCQPAFTSGFPTKPAGWSNPSSTCSPATIPSWCRPAFLRRDDPLALGRRWSAPTRPSRPGPRRLPPAPSVRQFLLRGRLQPQGRRPGHHRHAAHLVLGARRDGHHLVGRGCWPASAT